MYTTHVKQDIHTGHPGPPPYTPYYIQLFHRHHGRENSFSPIFQQKLRFIIKISHYLPFFSKNTIATEGSNSPVMFRPRVNSTWL